MRTMICIPMAAALFAACGDAALEEQQSSALLTTEFQDAVAVSVQGKGDRIISELRTLDGELVARAQVPQDGAGELSLMKSEPTPFVVARPLSLEQVHQVLHHSWQAIIKAGRQAKGEIEYGVTCKIGSVPVSCNKKYCKFPVPYQHLGGFGGMPYMTEAACRAAAASCKSPLVYYHKGYNEYMGLYSSCIWTGWSPIGYLDSVSGGVARGWACDKDDPAASIKVHIYIGGPAGSGIKAYGVTANRTHESAVTSACKGGKAHRFSFTIPKWKSGQAVYAYGINIGGGKNKLLKGSPKVIP